MNSPPLPVSPTALLPRRPCSNSISGCPNLTGQGGLCKECQSGKDQARGSASQRGYGVRHDTLRVRCFVRDGWRCQTCGWEPEIVEMARRWEVDLPRPERVLEELRKAFLDGGRHLHADHQIPIRDRPDLAGELGNYQTLCDRCHDAKTLEEVRRRR